MKKYLIALIIFSAFKTIIAQVPKDPRTITTRIADLLAQVPAKDAAQLERNMNEIGEIGDQGLEEMARMLAAPGKGDNTPLEYALSGFSNYVTRPGKQAWRAWCVAAYAKVLDNLSDPENKAFIIQQLTVVGNDGAVNVLKKYLQDERLCDPAARAMVKINTAAARKSLLNALQNASDKNRLTIIEALGDAHSTEAATAIAQYVASKDQKLSKLSLYTLALMAHPASQSLLERAAAKSHYTYEETEATAAYLVYAKQLYAKGKAQQAEKIGIILLNRATQDNQVHTRTAALKLLTDIKGEKTVPLLISATNDKNAQYRAAALKFATGFNSHAAIAAWVKKLSTAGNTVKAEIIAMLGNTGNRDALPAVLQALNDKDGKVRLAAIKSAGQIGQQKALPALLHAMKNGNPEEVTAITNAILVMKGPGVINQLGEALPKIPAAEMQAAVIGILAAREADSRISDVLPLVKSEDSLVRKAAFSALKSMVKQENLPQLYTLLVNADNPKETRDIQMAIITAAGYIPTIANRTAQILAQMRQIPPEKQYLFFEVLSAVGGKEALQVVAGAFTTGNEQTSIASIQSLSNWTDAAAATPLLDISRKSNNGIYSEMALNGYLQLTSRSGYTDDQRLLMLRNAMAIASTSQQKQLILREAGKCKTYIALLFAGKYLDDPVIGHDAGYAVMKIALTNKSWNGERVRSLLEKSVSLLNGTDAEYEKQAIRKHLADLPSGEGFVALFNEKDLSGWKGLVANPILRSKMDAATLVKEQDSADYRMHKGWYVKEGELVFSGKGDNLCTVKKYGDFEMFVDWKITKDGDAGIYLRGSPQVQVWDTSRVDVGAQVGSGGLYNNKTYESKPLKLADNAIGEWNSFHIIMKGDRVTVFLNGELVVNNTILENYWDRKLPIFPEEQIELQAHGTYVAYRDLYIKEIPRTQLYHLSEEEKKEGFKVLFDGSNMNEWVGNTTEYIIEDGTIAVHPLQGNHGNLYTKDEYSDFVYRFEFQLTPGANNGIGIRAPLEGDAAYAGMEIQVLDNEAAIYKNLHPYQYHGSVYGIIPAKRGYLKPVGEWNYEEITAKGNRIKVVLNGTTILDGDIQEATKNGTMDGKEHPGLKNSKGHIGFLGHGDVVRFRNIRIKI